MALQKIRLRRFILAACLCTALAMTVHIKLQHFCVQYVSTHMEGVTVAHAPYNTFITSMAYLTFVVQALVVCFAYYLVRDYMPCKSAFGRGCLFGLFIMLMNGELLRQPFMNYLVGNPVLVILVQQGQVWISTLVASIVIAWVLEAKHVSD